MPCVAQVRAVARTSERALQVRHSETPPLGLSHGPAVVRITNYSPALEVVRLGKRVAGGGVCVTASAPN
jgi:hypothetical protein